MSASNKEINWSRIGIRIKKYGLWFIVNFIIAMVPFAIMFALNYSEENIFSNFLSFNFGLVISSFYVLISLLDSRIESQDRPTLLLVLTILWILILIVTYVLYPNIPNKDILKFFNDNMELIPSTIFLITILISFFLNKPNIEGIIEELNAASKMEKSQEIKMNVQNMSRELEMDGTL